MSKSKTIIIMGPTASGKTAIAVRLAQIIQGEIISADSRQVYRQMDIGSGKDLHEYGSIPFHLIDVVDAGGEFSVSDFQSSARTILSAICQRNKIPIICGGTGHYIKALLEDYRFDHESSNLELTRVMESLPITTLHQHLKALGIWEDRNWDKDSKRRIVRAIEKELSSPKSKPCSQPFSAVYDYRIFFIQTERSILIKRIQSRLKLRLNQGLVEETERLLQQGISHQRLERYGLEYKYISLYLQGRLQKEEMTRKLLTEITRYAKRQMTFIRYMQRCGHELIPVRDFEEIWARVADWLNSHPLV